MLDFVAKWGIIVGGVGTIAVVSMVCVFLAFVAAPLFFPPKIEEFAPVPAPWGSTKPTAIGCDDQQEIGWAVLPDGRFLSCRLDAAGAGQIVHESKPFGSDRPTAFSKPAGTTEFVVGFSDGTLRRCKITTVRNAVAGNALPEEVRSTGRDAIGVHDGAIIRASATGALTALRIIVETGPPVVAARGRAIVLADQSVRPAGPITATMSADGTLHVHTIRSQRNLATGKLTETLVSTQLPYAPRAGALPSHLLLSGVGDTLFLVWDDGFLRRYDIRTPATAAVVEEIDLLPEPEARVTALTAMIGKATLAVGDSLGRLRGWFRVKPADYAAGDGSRLVMAHELAAGGAAVTALAPSTASRLIAVGYADGRTRLFNMTTERLLADRAPPAGATEISTVGAAPRDDGVLAALGSQLIRRRFIGGHSDISLAALFLPVWYEGDEHPSSVWQTSSGSDSYEPKYGFGKLVFGTLKATFYSLLFGVPVAILAAIYASEFLSPRWKAWIKPTVELMAGLPSVVLGFMAALVLAPLVESVVANVLALGVAVPFVLLLGAHLWQLLPRKVQLGWYHSRFRLIFVALLIGPLLAWRLGPILERMLFAGDVVGWLSGRIGSATGGWTMLLFPWAAAAVVIFVAVVVTPWVRRMTVRAEDRTVALTGLAVYLAGWTAACLLAWLGGRCLSACGWNPRGSLLGSYEQRNSLIVGFAMAFAVIPIIFTIAEDALSTVPSHLRSASLGAGATRWQTAVRIVVPTAMSGLFSAVMVGMGRAVGETMIVLMAAGNTPIWDINIFNGFRSLSANIAVELPEAVRNSTHYRTLFLSALVLFLLTFVLNTAAELVRRRFRKRAYQL